MATTAPELQPMEQSVNKGLKGGALGLISSTVIATASVAPAYSIAATLGFVVLAVGLKAPAVAVLAFVPMLLTSIGYSELNKADPDCGTTFTWATRAFGPRTGWRPRSPPKAPRSSSPAGTKASASGPPRS
jgi:amino acid transporter